MPAWVCERCGLQLSTKHTLRCHLERKYRCIPPGRHQNECRVCNKHFDRKSLLDQHLRTQKHERAAAAAGAASCAGSQAEPPESTIDAVDAVADEAIMEAAIDSACDAPDVAPCENSAAAGEAQRANTLNATPVSHVNGGYVVNFYNTTNITNTYNCCAKCPGRCEADPSNTAV